jgi:hypothetical protein
MPAARFLWYLPWRSPAASQEPRKMLKYELDVATGYVQTDVSPYSLSLVDIENPRQVAFVCNMFLFLFFCEKIVTERVYTYFTRPTHSSSATPGL